jgi:hypothetical protein
MSPQSASVDCKEPKRGAHVVGPSGSVFIAGWFDLFSRDGSQRGPGKEKETAEGTG